MNAVHFIGVNERRRSRPDQCCLALNGHSHVAFHEQKQFFVLVPVRWMRLASRGQGGFMYLEMLASVQGPVQDCPGFVLSIWLNWQIAVRLDEGGDDRVVKRQCPGRRDEGNRLQKSTPCAIHNRVCYRPSGRGKSRQASHFADKIVGN
jgi:hypothetical protein